MRRASTTARATTASPNSPTSATKTTPAQPQQTPTAQTQQINHNLGGSSNASQPNSSKETASANLAPPHSPTIKQMPPPARPQQTPAAQQQQRNPNQGDHSKAQHSNSNTETPTRVVPANPNGQTPAEKPRIYLCSLHLFSFLEITCTFNFPLQFLDSLAPLPSVLNDFQRFSWILNHMRSLAIFFKKAFTKTTWARAHGPEPSAWARPMGQAHGLGKRAQARGLGPPRPMGQTQGPRPMSPGPGVRPMGPGPWTRPMRQAYGPMGQWADDYIFGTPLSKYMLLKHRVCAQNIASRSSPPYSLEMV